MDTPERSEILAKLQVSRDAIRDAVAGLTETQVRFKSESDHWSIEEIVEHLAVAEYGMLRMITADFKEVDAPQDEISAVSLSNARDRKALPLKAPARAHPKGRFGSLAGALDQFLANRERTIEYVTKCEDDLRLRMVTHPLGPLTCRDCLKVMANHPRRHIEQIREIQAEPGFPR